MAMAGSPGVCACDVTRHALETSFTAVKGLRNGRARGATRSIRCMCVPGSAGSDLGRLLGERVGSELDAGSGSQHHNLHRPVDNIRAIFPNIEKLGDLEISSVRPVDHLKGPAWLTCLKLDAHGKPQEYALFIQDNKIIDSRAGVVIDQCYKQTFEHFDLPTPAAKKAGP